MRGAQSGGHPEVTLQSKVSAFLFPKLIVWSVLHIYMSGGSHPWVLGLQQAAFATRHFAIVCTDWVHNLPLLRNSINCPPGPYFQTAPHFQTDNAAAPKMHPLLSCPTHLHKLSSGPFSLKTLSLGGSILFRQRTWQIKSVVGRILCWLARPRRGRPDCAGHKDTKKFHCRLSQRGWGGPWQVLPGTLMICSYKIWTYESAGWRWVSFGDCFEQ